MNCGWDLGGQMDCCKEMLPGSGAMATHPLLSHTQLGNNTGLQIAVKFKLHTIRGENNHEDGLSYALLEYVYSYCG